jgi:thiaminase/transcriptional activator TenA
MTNFTKQLWQDVKPIFQAITEHAFIQELAQGNLSQERFAFYLQQDTLYLNEFAKVLALVGIKAEATTEREAWFKFALEAIQAEQSLHRHYLAKFAIESTSQASLACSTYTNFLLATAYTNSYAEAVAAALPCFWIYWEVGKFLVKIKHKHNPYAAWIEVYSSRDFSSSVKAAIALTEVAAKNSTAATRKRMQELFITASRLEWSFWDSAYHCDYHRLTSPTYCQKAFQIEDFCYT